MFISKHSKLKLYWNQLWVKHGWDVAHAGCRQQGFRTELLSSSNQKSTEKDWGSSMATAWALWMPLELPEVAYGVCWLVHHGKMTLSSAWGQITEPRGFWEWGRVWSYNEENRLRVTEPHERGLPSSGRESCSAQVLQVSHCRNLDPAFFCLHFICCFSFPNFFFSSQEYLCAKQSSIV